MTIKDLARISGYSLGTVSRALNHQPNVSKKARDRILSLADQYGYEINSNAQSLKQQNSNALLVIVKGRANELFSGMVEHAQKLAADSGQPLLVDYIDEDENEVHRAIQLCREKKPRGILFFGGIRSNFERDFHKITLPAVLVTNSAEGLGFPCLSSVTTDDTAAACAATTLLIQRGHKKIAVIGGDPEVSEISRNRLSGCEKAFLDTDAQLMEYTVARFSFQGGYKAMEKLIRSGKTEITAIFAMSDVMAIGAMRCLHEHGVRVPEEVSVVGFDGLPIGQYYMPRLVSVAQSTEELAKTGYQVLQEALFGNPSRYVTVPYAMTNGESVGPNFD